MIVSDQCEDRVRVAYWRTRTGPPNREAPDAGIPSAHIHAKAHPGLCGALVILLDMLL